MGSTQAMTAKVAGGSTTRTVRVHGVFPRGISAGTCLALIVLAAPISTAHAHDSIYYGISANGTIRLADTPPETLGDRHVILRNSKGRYHASVSDQELEEAVTHYAKEYRLSPALLLAIIKAESGFNPTVISKAGAVGLMQLIPETAIRHGVRNLYDTRDNIAGGARHLRYLLDRFHGNVRLALAAYNAGERKVERYRQIPPYKETRSYVKKVMGFYRDYRSASFLEAGEHVASRNMMR
jgi:soluble lytic murein transglycosylase